MPLHHYGLPVGAHFEVMRDFYIEILKPIGYEIMLQYSGPGYCAFGLPGTNPEFWLGGGRQEDGLKTYGGDMNGRICPIHVAFKAESPEQVDKWYENAM